MEFLDETLGPMRSLFGDKKMFF